MKQGEMFNSKEYEKQLEVIVLKDYTEGIVFRVDSTDDFRFLIKAIRERAGITQTQLAETLGSNQTTISQWEQGIVTPTLATMLRIVSLIQTPILVSAHILGE